MDENGELNWSDPSAVPQSWGLHRDRFRYFLALYFADMMGIMWYCEVNDVPDSMIPLQSGLKSFCENYIGAPE